MSKSMTNRPAWGSRTTPEARGNQDWWPTTLNLSILHQSHPSSNPLGADFDYGKAFAGVDVTALAADVDAIMTDSQEWWPADWGHYGPFFIRLSWHAAGTYRQADGRGGGGTGAQRFAPLNSWPDNGNLDKARRLLWPVKQKYGKTVSWADLFLYVGNRALETMGFSTFGFAFGRADIWAPEDDIYWGPETGWLDDDRYSGTFEKGTREIDGALGAVQMGLIYVNPTGPNGVPDALKSAYDIRQTFGRMAMNDRETAALVIGGHTFGKMHGAVTDDNHGSEPEGAPLAKQGLGWENAAGSGHSEFTLTSGIEGAWTATPTTWDNSYLDTLFGHEWELTESPAGAPQWEPKSVREGFMVPDAHVEGQMNKPVMSTADMALITDEAYLAISKEFHENPDVLADEFGRAWFKLLHRDLGPRDRYLGPDVPSEVLVWQDPTPAREGGLINDAQVASLKSAIAASDLTTTQLVSAAWASASTYRQTDHRGGANGARVQLEPQAGWDVNVTSGVGDVIRALETIKGASATNVSLADLIVLGGCVGVEQAAKAAGHDVTVAFTPGRTDATQEQTEVDTFGYLEPKADAFRNYLQKGGGVDAEHLLVDKAFMLQLSAPEMAVLLGGMRVLGANADGGAHGVLTDRPGQLTNDFFVNLLDMGTVWAPVGEGEDVFAGTDRVSGDAKWTATRVDLVFGSNSQLRAIAEEYAADDADATFAQDFADAFAKVMMLGRFDVA
ncbi:MAG: catalase-peroxidase [Myxococcota bacterium]